MYLELCDQYYKKGISVIPSRGKKVDVPNFGQYSSRQPNDSEINFFKKRFKNSNIGVMMGMHNKLMCLDVDTDKKDVVSMVRSVAPKTPCEKRGMKGMTMFYRRFKKENEMFISKDNGCMLEYLCTSKYTIVPPSIHPKTKKEYVWLKDTLIDSFDHLPTISDDALQEIDIFMRKKHKCITLKEFRGLA